MARLAASSKIQDSYTDALPASRALYERARRIFPDAVTHDNRRMQPFPLYVARAEGAYKWDVDGHRLRRLLDGPRRVAPGTQSWADRGAVSAQALRGTHYGRLPRKGSRVGRVGLPAGTERRARALHGVGHRGHAHGGSARPSVHGQAATS